MKKNKKKKINGTNAIVGGSFTRTFKLFHGNHNRKVFTIEAKFILGEEDIIRIIDGQLSRESPIVIVNGNKYLVCFHQGVPFPPKEFNEVPAILELIE